MDVVRARLLDSEPNSAIIRTWLASQPPGEHSALIRQTLVAGITITAMIERLEALEEHWKKVVERIGTAEYRPATPPEPPVPIDAMQTADPTLLATLLTFE